MPLTTEQFGKALVASGLMTTDELKSLWAELPAAERPKDGESFSSILLKRERLNEFQAQELLSGNNTPLILNQYVLLSKIGAGGMGQIFKAQHRKMKRLAAIKLLPAAMTKDEAAVKRFQREVEAAAKLSHPNIVQTHDADECRGIHFMVMEYVEGQDLSALVKQRGPLPVAEVVDYMAQAARGLAFAHSKGVVHRDIKPANLLLDNEGVVKILDMGLARIEDANAADQQLTNTGAVMGTVDYMAPEQATDTRYADARSDIYSLGCSLYRLLTAQSMFDGDTVVKKIMAHMSAPVPSLMANRPDAPAELDRIFQKMVAKKPEDRYAKTTDLVVELETLRGGGSSASVAASNQELNSFVQALHRDKQSTSSKSATMSREDGVTEAFGGRPQKSFDVTYGSFNGENQTDPNSEVHLRSGGGGKKPPLKLIAAGAAGFLFLLLGVWVIIRDKDGQEVARVKVPEGGTATVQATPAPPKNTAAPKPTLPATSVVPPPTATIAPSLPPPPAVTSVAAESKPAVRWPLQPSKPEDIVWLHTEMKATLTLRSGPNQQVIVKPENALPARPATLVGVEFRRDGNQAMTDGSLKRLATLVDLENLVFPFGDYPPVTKDGMAHLGALVNLRRLELGRMGPKDTDATFLTRFQQIESLTFGAIQFSNWEPHVARLTTLTELILNKTDDAKLEQLGPLPRLKLVRTSGYDTDYAKRLAGAKRLAPLVPWCRFEVYKSDKTRDGIDVIEPTAPPPAATSTTGDDPATVAKWLLDNKKLARIRFEIDGRTQMLSTVPTGPFKVIELNFSKSNNAGQSLSEEEVARLAVFTDVEWLELSTLTDAGLAKLAPLKKLKSLIVPNNTLTPAAVATIRQFPQLEQLQASGDDEWLKPLAGMPTLRSMIIWNVDVSPQAMSWFPQYPNLNELRFHNCFETPDDRLSLALAPLKDCKNLKKLFLNTLKFDADALAVLSGLTGLTELDLYQSNVSEAQLKQLTAALPRCQVKWRDAANNFKQHIFEPTAPPAAPQATVPTATSGKLFMQDPSFAQWLKDTAAKPAEAQLAAVSKKLMELHSGFDGKLTDIRGFSPPTIEDGVVTQLKFNGPDVTDISPLRALTGLKALSFGGSGSPKGKLTDLSPLVGMQVTDLTLSGMGHTIADLTLLKDLQLEKLTCRDLRTLADLAPLKGMPLKTLDLLGTAVADVAPLQGMPLEVLVLPKQIKDLAILKGMPLTRLECTESIISDLSPLRGMPLETFWCKETSVADLSPLYECKSLKELNVAKTKVTPAVVAALQKALPNCKVIWDDPAKATPNVGTK